MHPNTESGVWHDLPGSKLLFKTNNDECKECYFCCEDVPDSEKLQQCKDIGMPVNRQCKKTYENEQCKLKATEPATDVNKTEVNNNTFDLKRPSKQPPAPIYDDNKNNTKGSPAPAGADYKGFYIVGGLLVCICLVAITVKIYRSRRPSQHGNREESEQGTSICRKVFNFMLCPFVILSLNN